MWFVICKIVMTWLCLCQGVAGRCQVKGVLTGMISVKMWVCLGGVPFLLWSFGIYGEGLVGDGGARSHPAVPERPVGGADVFLLLPVPSQFILRRAVGVIP